MTKPLIREHNMETGKIIDREMTDIEFASYEANKAEAAMKAQAEAAAQTQKATAEAKLIALGLTADDIKALGLA